MKEYDDYNYGGEPENEESSEAVNRFEDMLKLGMQFYFDVDEFESIVEFYLFSGRIEMAQRALSLGLKQHPHSNALQVKSIQLLLEQEKPAEALKQLRLLENQDPENFEIFLLRGNALLQMGNFKEGNHQFKKALLLAPLEERESILYSIASSFIHEFNFKTALIYLLKSYKANPHQENVLFDLGFCYEKLERHDQSIQFYEKCIDENPFSEYAWFNLGINNNQLGNYDRAIECYDYALAINEDYLGAYFNKANTLANAGKYHEAIAVYHAYTEVEKDNIFAFYYIGECYEKLGDYDDAIAFYEKTLAIDSDFADAWLGLAIVKTLTGDLEAGLGFVQKALALDEQNPDYWFTFGKIQLKLDDPIQALAGFWRATEADPYDFEAWVEMSDMLFRQNKVAEAMQIIESALAFDSENALYFFRMAAYSFHKRANKTGYQWLEKGLKSSPSEIEEFFLIFPKGRGIKGILKMMDRYDPLPGDSSEEKS